MDKTAIRDAATVIVLRDRSVLMGQRGQTAAFMPGKFVFPGGAVDPDDHAVPVTGIDDDTHARLREESLLTPETLAAAAIRELWEETGQVLGQRDTWDNAPAEWQAYAAAGFRPNAAQMEFFFRAVTPAGRPRRFDARFFLINADHLQSDPDDFSGAEDELSYLQWVPLAEARQFNLPFITKVVLAELIAHLDAGGAPRDVPFFRNDDETHLVTRLNGAPLL